MQNAASGWPRAAAARWQDPTMDRLLGKAERAAAACNLFRRLLYFIAGKIAGETAHGQTLAGRGDG